jgi:hypothetical protein
MKRERHEHLGSMLSLAGPGGLEEASSVAGGPLGREVR